MAIAEPANELWAAVRAIDPTLWPPDDEEQVKGVADDWRKAAETAHLAGTDLADARADALRAWRDQGGAAAGDQLDVTNGMLARQKAAAQAQAGLADQYAQVLVNVKNAIVRSIQQNLPAYLQLGNPQYGAAGVARQQEFARRLAGQLAAMVAGQTQGLRKPQGAPESDTLLGDVGDIAGAVSAVAGGLALIPVLTPFAAPVAALAGATALTAHAVDMVATESYDDPNAWVGLGGDAVGMLPAGRLLTEATDVARAAPEAIDVADASVGVALQGPAVSDVFVDNDVVDDSKDVAGGGSLVQNSLGEVVQHLPR